MNKRRLLKLADLLEEDAQNDEGIKFDMSVWGWVRDRRHPLSCETRACAMGLAALSGKFKRAGLGYRVETYGRMMITMHGHGWGLSSAQDLFDLTLDQARYLFTGSEETGARGELMMAKRIRNFVKRALKI